MRDVERKRLVRLIEEAHKKSAEAIHEHITATLKEKGRFNSKTDADRQSIYEIEADHLLDKGVIVPPCKVGDTVYRIYTNSWIGEDKVCRFSATESGLRYHDDKGRETSCDKFGKLVFNSKAEAEYALKNRRSVSLVNGHIEE